MEKTIGTSLELASTDAKIWLQNLNKSTCKLLRGMYNPEGTKTVEEVYREATIHYSISLSMGTGIVSVSKFYGVRNWETKRNKGCSGLNTGGLDTVFVFDTDPKSGLKKLKRLAAEVESKRMESARSRLAIITNATYPNSKINPPKQ